MRKCPAWPCSIFPSSKYCVLAEANDQLLATCSELTRREYGVGFDASLAFGHCGFVDGGSGNTLDDSDIGGEASAGHRRRTETELIHGWHAAAGCCGVARTGAGEARFAENGGRPESGRMKHEEE
jgi:hypothetical protein